ncbi:MAG TPA: hypothetical protein VJY62_18460 [Bacteroidia bacterium]|nr:hypothetical protein [Bacteroidia bacterium]
MSWHFNVRKNDAGFDPNSSRRKDLGEHSIRTFTREFDQNSNDVPFHKDRPVILEYRVIEHSKNDVKELKQNLGKDFIDKFLKSYEEANTDEKEGLKQGYDLLTTDAPCFSLLVIEKNCKGLTGPEELRNKNESSNFDALCRKINTNVKETSTSGGTWGKGSSIYTFSSAFRTWFAYSNLSEEWNEQKRRFIGRTQLSPYVDYGDGSEKECFDGNGWYCREGKEGLPFINEKADAEAEKFYMPLRSEDDYGTSFFIPAFISNIENPTHKKISDEIISQTLQNWYIPIYEGKLIIKVVLESGGLVTIDKEYLYTPIEPLKYKLEILDWYYKEREENARFNMKRITIEVPALKESSRKDRKIDYASKPQKINFDLVIRKLDEHEKFENDWQTINKTALVRNKGMLISNYYNNKLDFLTDQEIRTEAILFSGLMTKSGYNEEGQKHADLFLGYSENADHNQWCSDDLKVNTESYLERFEDLPRSKGRPMKASRVIYELLNTEIYNAYREFFAEARKRETNDEICQIFQKLASLKVKGRKQERKSLVSITKNLKYDNYPEIGADGSFVYHLIVERKDKEKNVIVSFNPLLESLEGKTSDFEELGVAEFEIITLIDDDKGKVLEQGKSPAILLNEKNESFKVAIKTCSIAKNNSFKNLQPLIRISIQEN